MDSFQDSPGCPRKWPGRRHSSVARSGRVRKKCRKQGGTPQYAVDLGRTGEVWAGAGVPTAVFGEVGAEAVAFVRRAGKSRRRSRVQQSIALMILVVQCDATALLIRAGSSMAYLTTSSNSRNTSSTFSSTM